MENIASTEIRASTVPDSARAKSGESGLLRQKWEMYVAILALTGIALHLILRFIAEVRPATWKAPLIVVLVAGGLPLVLKLALRLRALELNSDLLAGISIAVSVVLGQYLVGVVVILMLSGGSALEHFASRRASSVLRALSNRMPHSAHRKEGSGVVDVTLDSIAIGDPLVVFPHEICPVDGVVIEGHGVIDESYLTGEPFKMPKTPGSQILSGTINQDTALTVRAEKLPVDSRYAKIMKVMQDSEQNRPQLRRVGDRLGAWYTPAALVVAALGWALSGASQRFLAILVIATPCPLLIAIPVAVIGAISLAARRGIIIKNPAILERLTTCRTLIFDKTGTLTYGAPALTEMICAKGFARREVLQLAASLERYSKHPLAGAILDAARNDRIELETTNQMSEKPGEGLSGNVEGRMVVITGRGKVGSQELPLPPMTSGLECLVFIDGQYAATFRFHDAPRHESRKFVTHLEPSHQVDKVMLVSGDRESEVRYLAEEVGITEIFASQSPEEKLALVREETKKARTLFVGDGINDAPALQAATVGVAFGQNSDIAAEAAGAVVLNASLAKVDELIHIGRRMRSIALQSAAGGMALSIVGMIAAAFGYLSPLEGAVAQEVIDLVAVLNAVRVALPFQEITDF